MTDTRVRAGDIVAQVHEQLRDAILNGDIRPGIKTSQAELARDLGVGRTPLREAVRMLQDEGLVLAEPNRRVQIASLSVAGRRGALRGADRARGRGRSHHRALTSPRATSPSSRG